MLSQGRNKLNFFKGFPLNMKLMLVKNSLVLFQKTLNNSGFMKIASVFIFLLICTSVSLLANERYSFVQTKEGLYNVDIRFADSKIVLIMLAALSGIEIEVKSAGSIPVAMILEGADPRELLFNMLKSGCYLVEDVDGVLVVSWR